MILIKYKFFYIGDMDPHGFLETFVCLLCRLCHTFYNVPDKLDTFCTFAFKKASTIGFRGKISIEHFQISHWKVIIDRFLL